MAIQDDNTILNKGDLKAYHEAIAPMLGGTFMVSTNNSDFYSTDEKVVGVWIDGKPLYQKTFITTSPSAIDTSKNISIGATIDKGFVMSGSVDDGLGNLLPLPFSTNAGFTTPIRAILINNDSSTNKNTIQLYTKSSSWLNKTTYLTIQYTKTTDTAGSATTTPGAYDINFPNTWKENTEIYFGNGLYGYRWFNGSVTFSNYWHTSSSTDNGIKAGNNIISYGGNVRPANTTGSSAISAFYVNNNNTVAFKWDWTSSSVLAEVDAWYTYTK